MIRALLEKKKKKKHPKSWNGRAEDMKVFGYQTLCSLCTTNETKYGKINIPRCLLTNDKCFLLTQPKPFTFPGTTKADLHYRKKKINVIDSLFRRNKSCLLLCQ